MAKRVAKVVCVLQGVCWVAGAQVAQVKVESRVVPVIVVDGLRFRDLNRDGKLEPFEDWRLPAKVRAANLVGRMSLEEKAGLMMHASAPAAGSPEIGRGAAYDLDKVKALIEGKKVNTFITRLTGASEELARQNNLLQEAAEVGRFGIPVTVSTDPRNSFTATVGASNEAAGFSQWPDTTGLGALGEPAVTRRFGEIARQEYAAVGIREALSPQADLSTEPRWPRIDGTFGEDALTVKAQVEAYVAGFQDGETGLHPGSVACVVKHFAGYGAMKDGWDAHNSYGRRAVFAGNEFQEHLVPFEGAFKAKVAGVMPTYAIVEGATVAAKPLEAVGAGFNKQLLTGVLRDQMHFDGVVVSDWLITSNCEGECLTGAAAGARPQIAPGVFGMPWGVETLTPEQRYAKALAAGVDQFGGVSNSELIVKLVRDGKVAESRIDASAERLLEQKFELGLFEDPYVDAVEAGRTVGKPEFRQAAVEAQERSMVLLVNKSALLPVQQVGPKVYLVGVDAGAARRAGLVPVENLAEASVAVVRMHAPYQVLHPGYFFGSRQHEGDLDFKADDPQYVKFLEVAAKVPTVAALYLDRPAILGALAEKAGAVLVNFGASDDALMAVVTGKARPEGRLPFELPRSMDAVRAQRPDLPHDSVSPLFALHFGLGYRAGL